MSVAVSSRIISRNVLNEALVKENIEDFTTHQFLISKKLSSPVIFLLTIFENKTVLSMPKLHSLQHRHVRIRIKYNFEKEKRYIYQKLI